MISSVINDNCFEFRGLSTDSKPVNEVEGIAVEGNEFISEMYIGNGSVFFEIDTSEAYMFDKAANKWRILE